MEIMGKDKKHREFTLKNAALRWIWDTARGNRRYLVLLTALQILLNMASVCYSMLFRDLIDRAVEKQLSGLYSAAAALGLLAVGQLALRSVFRWLEEYTRSGVENGIKHRFVDVLLRKSYALVTSVNTGEWMNRLTSDTVLVADGVAQILPHLAGILVRMVGALVFILYFSPLFGAMILPAGVVFIFIAQLLRPKIKRLHARVQETDGSLRTLVQERLDNQLIVRAFGQRERTLELADEKMSAHQTARVKRSWASNLYSAGFGFVMQGMYLLGAVVGCAGIANGTVTFGTMTAVLQLISLLQSPLSEISGYFTRWYAMLVSAERLMEAEGFRDSRWLQVPSEEETLRFYQHEFAGISLERICFSHLELGQEEAARITIQNLNMELRKGDFIAITGSSGCGKSTLLKLLMGLYIPDSGDMRMLRKEPLADRPLAAADSGLFAYVPQGNQLMSGTIRSVLAFDDPRKMKWEDRLWQALRVACAADFVAALPDGLDSPLGERGSGLSEGQIQRLALARAIFSGRPVLLLDEATSSLDEDTEWNVLNNLRTMTDRTVILVTHRTRACEICDRVEQLNNVAKEGVTEYGK